MVDRIFSHFVIKLISGEGKFVNRRSKTSGMDYDRFFFYVPTDVARDSLFPFDEGDKVTIKIDVDKKCVMIMKLEED